MKHFILPVFLICAFVCSAQKNKKETSTTVTASPIQSKVAGMKYSPGYFDFYYDEKQDKMFLVIDKFDTEFLYIVSLPAGIGSNDIGLDRGQLGADRIVKFG